MARTLPASDELRSLALTKTDFEVRTDGEAKRFGGHTAVFNTRAAIGNPLTWGFYEEIAPGAFTRTLSGSDARMLVDHDSAMVVARVSAGTLRLAQDGVGLAVDSDLDTGLSYVSDLVRNLQNGNITGMSFGFQVVRDEWRSESVETNDGNQAEVEVRTLQEVKLIEVSPVTFPAYTETDAGVRALRSRGDAEAITRRLPHLPELAKLLPEIDDRDSGESARGEQETDPAASTRFTVYADLRMRELAARFGLPGKQV
ncbi:MAG: HK97 family phage prohead protease [Sciscionella sp.]